MAVPGRILVVSVAELRLYELRPKMGPFYRAPENSGEGQGWDRRGLPNCHRMTRRGPRSDRAPSFAEFLSYGRALPNSDPTSAARAAIAEFLL